MTMTLGEIKEILNDKSPELTEGLARRAAKLTQQFFGRTISLYAPLYISNYCSSHCTYCGFHSHHRIKRFKLTNDQLHKEMAYVANNGIENILLLAGESYQATPLSYLRESVDVAKTYFSSISLEVHPMEQEEYRELFLQGVDGITVYQETYDRHCYKEVHVSGKKADYDYRRSTPERAARGGMRNISMGILLGLADVAEDLLVLYEHLRYMEKRFPGVEYSLSFPRLKPIKGKDFAKCEVDDVTFIKIICLTRITFPRVGINLSTRENPKLRDHALELGVTKISAGSNTSVGGYTLKSSEEQDPQFDIEDKRSVQDIVHLLKKRDFDPVLTDWRRIENDVVEN
jgi:2-iminoacetate synthase